MTLIKWRKTKTLEQLGFIKENNRYKRGQNFVEVYADSFIAYTEYLDVAGSRMPLLIDKELALAALLKIKKGGK